MTQFSETAVKLVELSEKSRAGFLRIPKPFLTYGDDAGELRDQLWKEAFKTIVGGRRVQLTEAQGFGAKGHDWVAMTGLNRGRVEVDSISLALPLARREYLRHARAILQ